MKGPSSPEAETHDRQIKRAFQLQTGVERTMPGTSTHLCGGSLSLNMEITGNATQDSVLLKIGTWKRRSRNPDT